MRTHVVDNYHDRIVLRMRSPRQPHRAKAPQTVTEGDFCLKPNLALPSGGCQIPPPAWLGGQLPKFSPVTDQCSEVVDVRSRHTVLAAKVFPTRIAEQQPPVKAEDCQSLLHCFDQCL